MRSTLAFTLFLICLAGCSGPSSNESLTVNKLFRTGAVLQRNAAVPVWGTAAPSTTVTVSLDYAEQSVRAERDGTWMIELEPRPAGGPHQLMVATNTDTLIADNIMFGDVWIASGQSNMEWTVANSADAENEISSAGGFTLAPLQGPLAPGPMIPKTHSQVVSGIMLIRSMWPPSQLLDIPSPESSVQQLIYLSAF